MKDRPDEGDRVEEWRGGKRYGGRREKMQNKEKERVCLCRRWLCQILASLLFSPALSLHVRRVCVKMCIALFLFPNGLQPPLQHLISLRRHSVARRFAQCLGRWNEEYAKREAEEVLKALDTFDSLYPWTLSSVSKHLLVPCVWVLVESTRFNVVSL